MCIGFVCSNEIDAGVNCSGTFPNYIMQLEAFNESRQADVMRGIALVTRK